MCHKKGALKIIPKFWFETREKTNGTHSSTIFHIVDAAKTMRLNKVREFRLTQWFDNSLLEQPSIYYNETQLKFVFDIET